MSTFQKMLSQYQGNLPNISDTNYTSELDYTLTEEVNKEIDNLKNDFADRTQDAITMAENAATSKRNQLGQLVGLVESGKLEMDMAGFEIVYFLYPGSLLGATPSILAQNWNLGGFRLFEENNHNNPRSKTFNVNASSWRNKRGKMGWGLHQWTLGPNSLFYYTKDNKNYHIFQITHLYQYVHTYHNPYIKHILHTY